ncbi:MAG: hypothetical protein COA52_00775 [Hyphomicrobiales bacterium]|nr:MAG: hypothetical protein COA52_00775 [Hyphomicrobiales bacterium]
MSTYKPATRAEFKEFVLRQLGKPVIEINVSDSQVEDAVEIALSYFVDYHYDGTVNTFLKHEINANTISTMSVDVPDTVVGISNIFPIRGGAFSSNMFSFDYQFQLSMVQDMSSFSLIDYQLTRMQIAQIQETLVGEFPIRYNRHFNKVHLDCSPGKLAVGNWLVFNCYTAIDPEVQTDVWNDRILQKHVVALVKKVFGSNLSKYEGVQLPGGMTLSGRQIYDDGVAELQQIEDEYKSDYMLPPLDLIM